MTSLPQDMPPDASSADAPTRTAPLLPYAAPLPQVSAGEIFRQEECLVVPTGVTLPARCILCGGEGADGPVNLTFTWDDSFRVTKLSTLQLGRKGKIRAYLCVTHRRRWRSARFYGSLAAAASALIMLAGIVMGLLSENATVPFYTPHAIAVVLTGFGALICSLFFLSLRSRTLSCTRIEEGYLYLKGASPAFLETLSVLPQRDQ